MGITCIVELSMDGVYGNCNAGISVKIFPSMIHWINLFQVMLGSGERQYEDWMRVTEAHYRDKYRGWVGFNVPISHRITAG